MPAGLAVTDNTISFYFTYWSSPYNYFSGAVKNKSTNSTICTYVAENNITSNYLYSTKTYNGNVHVPLWYNYYYDEEYEPGIYQANGYNCVLEQIYWNNNQQGQNVHFINGSSSSNDVYVIWQDDYIGDDLRLIYDDQNPLAPQGLTPGVHYQGGESYAKLTWQLNNEPDVYIKPNAFEIWRRIRLWEQPWGSWGIVRYENGDVTEFIDYEIVGAFQSEVYTAEYKIRARDMNNHYSPYSNVVTIEFRELGKISAGEVGFDYKLDQNYPNPFNPTTTIDYSIKTAGLVTIKVFDMLGTEVANLVDQRKEPGNYSVEFNAENLPSGIYVYKLTAGKFIDTKKLILLR